MIESISASCPEFFKESDFVFFPIFLKYNPKNIFTNIHTIIIIKEIVLYLGVVGFIIFLTDSINEVKPAYDTITAIIIALKCSTLP